jgi:hypothetical protein
VGQLATICPTTGDPVPLGIEVSSRAKVMQMLDETLPLDGHVVCPHCGKKHEWSGRDVTGYLEA